MPHPVQQPSPRDVTLGDLVAVAFDQAEKVSSEPTRVAELATSAVKQNLMRSPDNAAAQRMLCRASREWERASDPQSRS